MNRGLGAAACAAFLWAFAAGACAAPAAEREDPQTRQALAAVEKILRGERVNDLDLKHLDRAVIRLESDGGGAGLAGGGVESAAGARNVYILRFDSGAGNERQVQVLRTQREILKNQLVLLKSLSTIANYQVMLGTRTARVENTMRDMTLGMKSSGSDLRKVAGDAAGTSAKMTDVASTTADMAVGMTEMAKNIGEIEGAIGNVESMIREVAGTVESQGEETRRGMRIMGRGIENRMSDSAAEVIRRDDKNREKLEVRMDAVGDAMTGRVDELEENLAE